MSTPTATPRAPAGRPPGSNPPGPQRSRRMQIVAVAVSAGLLVAAVLVFILQRGGDGGSGTAKKKAISGDVQMTLGGVQNANAGAPATLGDDIANQIMTALAQYVDQGLVQPAKTGKPAADLAGLFDAGTQVALQGPDKDVLFESGRPERTGDFKPAVTPVIITALSDGGGQFVLATAGFQYSAQVGVEGGTLATTRVIALTFTPENGQWKITSYDVTVSRQGAQVEVPAAATQQ
jgi:hypothetical protein